MPTIYHLPTHSPYYLSVMHVLLQPSPDMLVMVVGGVGGVYPGLTGSPPNPLPAIRLGMGRKGGARLRLTGRVTGVEAVRNSGTRE